ncbi:EsaB/YukD family protein [Paenibacillus sp. TRM 82003]|nr:EsaB/YukD family protein [Paenibacillus sp. TRM 82003]
MADDKAIVILKIHKRNFAVDVEIPLHISANELVIALNAAYELNIDVSDVKNCYLKAENPIALLKGNKLLSDYGVRNGTVINFTQ